MMHTRGEISQKLKQARFRHVKRELSRLLAVVPSNCTSYTTVKTKLGPHGVCKLDCQTCDARVSNRTATCGSFKLAHDKDELKASLKEFFQNRSVTDIAVRFPDVAALLWVLAVDDEDPQHGILIPNGIPLSSLYGIELWVDTQEEAATLAKVAKDFEADRALLASLARIGQVETEGLLECFTELLRDLKLCQDSVDGLGQELSATQSTARALAGENQVLTQKVADLEKVRDELIPQAAAPWWARLKVWQR
tara:strand:- start:1779 stop:2531 length:753 start_codon:yes stop_codon:yes gene_type:complete